MIAETTSFFREVLTRDSGLGEFLDPDWTVLNGRLAEHHGVAGVAGEEMRRVRLKPEQHPGGLLTQAAVPSLTSDGTRQRPVHRGVWVLESIVGEPPPANVPALGTQAASARKTTVREKLELHRSDANCAACHRRIDPLGLAFDNYDAIGRWRAVETVREGTGENPRLDPSGELADGRTFADAAALERLLLDDADRFAAAFAEKLATYALRRGVGFADRAELKRLVEAARPGGYKLATLVESFAASDLFLKRQTPSAGVPRAATDPSLSRHSSTRPALFAYPFRGDGVAAELTPVRSTSLAPAHARPAAVRLGVVGSGPGGMHSAPAALFGKRAAVVEKNPAVGGAAAVAGTLPNKSLRETALALSGFQTRRLYGVDLSLRRLATVADLLYQRRAVTASE